MNQGRQHWRAFTAIELSVIIIILGIVAAVLIKPVTYDTGTMTVDAEAKRLLADLRFTQSLSMFRNERYRLDFIQHQPISHTDQLRQRL